MTVPSALAALAALAAALAVLTITASPRARRPVVVDTPVGRSADVALLARLRPVLTPLAFAGGWAFVGGGIGLVAGAVVAGVTWQVLGRAESPSARRRRERMGADLPAAVQLLAATLRAGAAVESALSTVAEALPGPCGDEFARIHHQLRLGIDPAQVWMAVAEHPQLGPLGRTLGRAHETGAAVADTVAMLAIEVRAQARAEIEQRAKSVDVRASAPLGVCFLPAFVLLGVVPLVVGMFGSLRLFG